MKTAIPNWVVCVFSTCNTLSFMQWLVEYNAALASICFMLLLGFVDDVLDVPWRVWVTCLFVRFSAVLETCKFVGGTCFPPIILVNYCLLDPFILYCIFESQETNTAVICCSSLVDGICWTYHYYYTKASCSLCWLQDFGSRYGFE